MTNHPTTVMHRGGGNYTVVPDAAAPGALAPGTYGLAFSQMTGYTITTLSDLQAPTHRVYGRRDATVDKVLRAYRRFDRSLGVLFVGDKGIGKSLTATEIARRARDEFDLPIIMVTSATPGLADYLAGLGEAVIVFDEFEKNFTKGDDYGDVEDQQSQFLGLLDGTDRTKRLYLVTVNNMNALNGYFVNRPGRFHYLVDFDYPGTEEIAEYLTVEAEGLIADEQVAALSAFAYKAKLNYDHLRAIVTELDIAGPEIAPTLSLHDIVDDLNIRSEHQNQIFVVTAVFGESPDGSGTRASQRLPAMRLGLFSSDPGATEDLEWEIDASPRTSAGRLFADLDVDGAVYKLSFDPAGIALGDGLTSDLSLNVTGYGLPQGTVVEHGATVVVWGSSKADRQRLLVAATRLGVGPEAIEEFSHRGNSGLGFWVDLDQTPVPWRIPLQVARLDIAPHHASHGTFGAF